LRGRERVRRLERDDQRGRHDVAESDAKFPNNDHPSDKATYTLRFNVPAGTTSVGNGLPTDRRTVRGRTITTFEERDPMASELVSLSLRSSRG
jgi:hypothetical protein